MNSARVLTWAAGLLLALDSAAAQQASAPALQQRPLNEFQHMLERPLFSQHRRPPQEAGDDTESATERRLRDTWRLTGVVLERGRQLALFLELKSRQDLRLEAGSILDGSWRLEQIASDRVVLTRGTQQVEMLLYDPSNLPTAKPAAPARAPAAEQPADSPARPAEPDTAQPPIPAI